MAHRRPNMPRVRPAGDGADGSSAGNNDAAGNNAAGNNDAAGNNAAGNNAEVRTSAGGDLPVNRAKVVPLGSVPDERGGQGTARPARKSTAQTQRNTAGSKAGARKPGTPRPGSPRPGTPKAGKAGPSEMRLRERAVLSGGIRSGTGPTKAGHGRHPEPDQDAAPVPARAFSGRMLALAVILVVITILLLPSVGTYMNQRTELTQLQDSIAQKQTQQVELKDQIARWDDPVYIKAQARDRINLVMPGERKYMVIGSAAGEDAPASESPGEVRTDLPWVDALWDTVKRSATD